MLFVRKFTFADVEAVAELMGDLGYPTSVDAMQRRMEMIVSNPTFCTFLAENDGKVVGIVGASRQVLYEVENPVVQINLLVTKAGFRGLGIGKALMSEAEAWAKERGAITVFLTSGNRPNRAAAHKFYNHLGYEVNGYRFVRTL